MAATKEESSDFHSPAVTRPTPGLLLVFSGTEPRHAAWPIGGNSVGNSGGDSGPGGSSVTIGRDELLARGVHDERVSSKHIVVEYRDGGFVVRDLGSRNGSFLNGQQLSANSERRAANSGASTGSWPGAECVDGVLRIGRTLLLLVKDISPYSERQLSVEGGIVIGVAMRLLRERVAMLSRAGSGVLLTGESGTGKELLAQCYHTAGGAAGALVAVNCATIPRDLAERLLFGTRRGAYSGAATDAEGYVAAAHRGTLFLDELGELEESVQTKLLRVLESREVLPLGATRPQPVEFQLCAATLRDLRAEVEAGRFRQDLYFRVGHPELRLPALRERLEEIPWLLQLVISKLPGQPSSLTLGLSLVETCLLRPWPGNVRELLIEARAAALLAVTRSSKSIEGEDLSGRAGQALNVNATSRSAAPALESPPPEPLSEEARSAQVALQQEGGNVKRTAERLGISRGKLRRLIEKYRLLASSARDE